MPVSVMGVYAYTQMDNLVLCQMLSLFGPYSLSFLLAMFASLMEYAFQIYVKI